MVMGVQCMSELPKGLDHGSEAMQLLLEKSYGVLLAESAFAIPRYIELNINL